MSSFAFPRTLFPEPITWTPQFISKHVGSCTVWSLFENERHTATVGDFLLEAAKREPEWKARLCSPFMIPKNCASIDNISCSNWSVFSQFPTHLYGGDNVNTYLFGCPVNNHRGKEMVLRIKWQDNGPKCSWVKQDTALQKPDRFLMWKNIETLVHGVNVNVTT